MTKLKLHGIQDNKPIKITIEISGSTHQNLIEYAEIMAHETGQEISDPKRLVAPMLIRFMETDRAFLRAKRAKLSMPKANQNQ
jgi:hypothetical protein